MATRRQKIWVTRAQPGADVTAERVRALGHDAIVAPLLAVKVLPDVEVESGVLVTVLISVSARAAAKLAASKAAAAAESIKRCLVNTTS